MTHAALVCQSGGSNREVSDLIKDNEMLNYTAVGTCVLILTLGTILVIALVIHKEKSGKGVGTAILTALIGILLGAGGAAAGVQIMGYDLKRVGSFEVPEEADPSGTDAEGGGMGMMGMGGGGMGGGMGMMGGGGMGGSRGGGTKRQLTTLVRKINLLTGDVALELTEEQSNQLVGILNRIQTQDTMSDEEAETLQKQLLALLTEEQTAKQEAISLPRRRRGGAAGGAGGMGGGMGMMGGGGDAPSPDANPFEQEQNSGALGSLLQRFGEPGVAADTPATSAATDEPDEGAETGESGEGAAPKAKTEADAKPGETSDE
jgi:hypothetical protein